ncbi:mechanosensitive ion channel family protein [Actibacterium sp. 188UL27-1]|uniref:mechanosensitive ion channel family protein n=1 Tax=Actibacterium sp. 188UL27-1 TaxID=2786961 RepID=UPI00195A8729|nr:mechanosensitive ion channel domain-containing protein [Actibacterium sp. 188UL27-1]MBM7067258.1 mechanosensitive ion channel [Actibacterium sp. 188UL27-1]
MAGHDTGQTNPAETGASADNPETIESIAEDLIGSVSPAVDYGAQLIEGFSKQFSSIDGLIVLAVILGAFLVAWPLVRPVNRILDETWPTVDGKKPYLGSVKSVVKRITLPIVTVILLWIAVPILESLGITNDMLRVVASMLQAWIVINVFSAIVRDPFWSRIFAALAWFLAVLYILRLLNPLIATMESVGISIGSARITIFDMIKGAVLLVLLIWASQALVGFVRSRLSRSATLNQSIQTLIAQAVRLTAIFIAVLIALSVIGVDLTALAVFSGAIGVGIGIGLQAIVANMMAAVTLMLEGSIKIGDFIELENGTYGEIREITTRATRIRTTDNVDILVPNSEFINGRVTNWTMRDRYRRMRIPFGVAYGTDKELVKTAALEAADGIPHELTGPDAQPADVWLVGFGDSALNFELVVWLSPEAVKHPEIVQADYNWALETALAKHGIEIPFPQRDLHIRSGELPIRRGAPAPLKTVHAHEP